MSQNKSIDIKKGASFDVMTYNIKYDDKNDSINNWDARKEAVVGLIKYHTPELMGTQEGLKHQLDYINDFLPGYDYIGIGRDGGEGQGEYSAIFYKKDEFELMDSGTFWLSEDPTGKSMGWDAAYPRICTWGKFSHKSSGQTILYFNTHFDHKGKKARGESAKLISSKVKEIKGADNLSKVILSGDFNFTPDSGPYKMLIQNFEDTQQISKQAHYGPEATFNGFLFDKMPQRRIDYVFVQEGFNVLKHATLSDSKNMKYPSDHFPVITRLELKKRD